jgi:hypothetical protein
MLQTYYLHNGAHFDCQQLLNVMADQQSLWPISDNAPIVGPGLPAIPVQDKLGSAELLLEMSDIPVVTQNTQEREFQWNRLQLLFASNRLTLWPYPYFTYSIHTDASAFILINDPVKIPLSTGILSQNGEIMTMSSKTSQLWPMPTTTLPVMLDSLLHLPMRVRGL